MNQELKDELRSFIHDAYNERERSRGEELEDALYFLGYLSAIDPRGLYDHHSDKMMFKLGYQDAETDMELCE